MQPAARREVEIKLPLDSASRGRRLLGAAGFRLSRPRVFEANAVWDTRGHKLRRSGSLLRVRRTKNAATLTYKGPALAGKHKSREELEIQVSDPATLEAILARLGFQPVFRYDKFRSEYRASGQAGLITLDETPIGVFLELEGAPRWIDRTARALGFSEADYITETYAELYRSDCRSRGVRPSHMVFPANIR